MQRSACLQSAAGAGDLSLWPGDRQGRPRRQAHETRPSVAKGAPKRDNVSHDVQTILQDR